MSVVVHPQVADDPVSLLIPAFLVIERTRENDIKFRHLRAILDGQLLSIIHYGDKKVFTIRPGSHEIVISNTLNKRKFGFEIGSGQTIHVDCAQFTSNWGFFMYSMLGYGRMRVEADFHVRE